MQFRTREEISQEILEEVKKEPLTITHICSIVGIRYNVAKPLIRKLVEKNKIKPKEMRCFKNNKLRTHYLLQSIPSAKQEDHT